MASQAQGDKGPFYKELGPPFSMNEDDALSNLSDHEYPIINYMVEHEQQLWPVLPLAAFTPAGGVGVVQSFALPTATPTTIIFTSNSKMYTATVAAPGSTVLTEITVAGGSTAIAADSTTGDFGINLFSIAYVNGSLYFAHDGQGPLRVWAGGATYADVAAPGSGYHNGVKYKPYYLTAQNNRLILGGDAAAVVGTRWDVVGSTVTSAVDFTSFGSFYTQLIDTPDVISGLSILSGKLIVYKTDSIVIGTTTNDSTTPYSFERYQQSTQQTFGLWSPYTLANVGTSSVGSGGTVDIFLSRYGMVSFDGAALAFVGKGEDNKILSAVTNTVGANVQASALATMGSLYPYSSGSVMSDNATRFYAICPLPQYNGAIWLLNLTTGSWSKMSVGSTGSTTYGLGTCWFASSASGVAGVIPQKCIIASSGVIAYALTLALRAITVPNGAAACSLKIPCGPAIYGDGSWRTKTIEALYVEFQLPTGLTFGTFNVTVTVDQQQAVGSVASDTGVTAAITCNSGDPLPNPTIYMPVNTKFAVNVTNRTPVIVLSFPAPDGATSRIYPRIVRMAVKFQFGDDN